MKITKIEIFNCTLSRLDPKSTLNPVFVRLSTDEGISGVGEVGLAYGAGSGAAVGMLGDLAKLVIGQDPMRIEAIWESFFRNTFWGMGGGPVVYGACSAYDIALWDIKGKALETPIWQLLGGKTKGSLRTYASQIQFGWGPVRDNYVKPDDYAKAAKAALAEGYDCVKVDPIMIDKQGKRTEASFDAWNHYGILTHEQVRMGVDRVAAIRDAVGPKTDIIIEIHSLLGVNSAIQLGRALEPFNIFYYEEPVHPMNVENMALIARSVKIPVASGERIYTRWGYRPFFEQKALAVIQPDMCLAGGFSEVKKICDMANIYDATVQIHICGGPVTTAAALQLEAVIPNFIIHEHHINALNKANISLCKNDYQPQNGQFAVPDLPGLGQELNDSVVAPFLAAVVA